MIMKSIRSMYVRAAAVSCMTLTVFSLPEAGCAQDARGWEDGDPLPAAPGQIAVIDPANPPPPLSGGFTFVGGNNEADVVTPEIEALATALGDDVTRIFLWVRNNIRFTHYHGCRKGATLAYWERSGNDMDQAALLAATLRAAGHEVRYGYAMCFAPSTGAPGSVNWTDYFGVDVVPYNPANPNDSAVWFEALSSGGTPLGSSNVATTTGYETPSRWGLMRYWVEVEQGGQWLRYDPSYKPFKLVPAQTDVSLRSGHSRAGMLAAAGGTATTNPPSVSAISETSLNANLNGAAQALGNYVRDSQPNLSHSQAYGAQSFATLEPAVAGALTTAERFPMDVPGWTSVQTIGLIPTSLMSTLRLQLSATQGGATTPDKTFKFAELAGRNLTLEFDGTGATNQARLRLDEAIVATENLPIGAGANCWMRSTITHPGTQNQPAVDTSNLRGARYSLIYSFQAGEPLLRARLAKLAAYKEAGIADNSREVVTEGLHVMGLSWMRQTELVSAALAGAADLFRVRHHRLGRISQESSFYVDVGQQFGGTYRRRLSQTTTDATVLLRAESFAASAMEHGVLAQLQDGMDGVSTVRLAALNNAAATNPITYLATRSGGVTNWNTIKPLLTGYPASTLNEIEGAMTSTSNTEAWCLLPKNGNIYRNQWHGAGYVLERKTSTGTSVGMLISGNLNGGYASTPGTVASSPTIQSYQTYTQPKSVSLQTAFRSMAGDPVDLASGFFTATAPATLTLDNRPLPRGLSFSLSYDGGRRADKMAGVGYGWEHNLNAKISRRTEIEDALGNGSAEQGARFALGTHALLDLCRNLGSAKDWMVAQLVAQWMVDALTNNAVAVTIGGSTHQFLKKPDGSGFLLPTGSTLSFSPAAANASGRDEVRERHGNVYRFNNSGRLRFIEDTWGKVAELSYNDTTGRLITLKDAYNRVFNFAWDANDRLDYVSDPQSTPARVLDLSYDAGGHLITITDPEGKADHFEYDAQHRLTKHRDHDLRVITHNTEFDSEHRVTKQKGQGLDAQLWQFAYAPGITRVTDPAGHTEEQRFDAEGRPQSRVNQLGHRSMAVFDGQNHVIQRLTPLGRSTSATYDGHHNLLTSTASSGGATPAVSTTTNTYDGQHRLKTVTDPLLHTVTYAYHGDADAGGVSDPDAKHQPVRVYHSVNGTLIETRTTYNAAGDVESITDPAGNVTTFAYDTQNRLTHTYLPGPDSPFTQVIAYTAAGDPQQVRDARGSITTLTYNKRRELTDTGTAATTVDNVVQNIATGVRFDNNRNAYKHINALGHHTESTFSPTGRLLSTRHSALPGVNLAFNQYDVRDLLWKATNVLGQTTTHTYDAASRLTDTDDHLARNVHVGYDPDDRVLTVRNTLAKTTTSTHLDHERQFKSRNPLLQEWTTQTDARGNLCKRVNARNRTWVYSYDDGGRLTSLASPENRLSQTTWNTRGLPHTVTEPSGQQTAFAYDARGRPDLVTGADYTLDHTFDPNGNLTGLGETTAALGTRSVAQSFDEVNRVKTYTNAEGETLKYVWDEGGSLRFLEYPDGQRAEYQYDARARLRHVSFPGVGTVEFQWDDASRLTRVIRPNGTVRELFYDAANRLERIEERGAGGRLFFMQRCGYDAGDRMTKRLILPVPPAWAEPADSAVFDGDNWMTGFNGAALGHDADGNLMGAPTRPTGHGADVAATFTWDARNRMVSCSTGVPPVASVHCTYSPDGHLTHLRKGSATANAGVRLTVNPHGAGGLSQVLVSTDLATGEKTRYLHGLGLLCERRADGGVRWHHHDHLGNLVAMTDAAGAVTGRAHYSLYGMAHGRTGDAVGTPFLFGGRFGVYTEAASGSLHMRARWFSPRLRRFLSSDPAGFGGGWNFYAYADGNPVSMIDPFGLGAQNANSGGFWTSNASTNAVLNQISARNARQRQFQASQYYYAAATDHSAEAATDHSAEAVAIFAERRANDPARIAMEATLWGLSLLEPTPAGEYAMAARTGTRVTASAARTLPRVTDDVIHVTPSGVAFPPGPKYKIPSNYVENAHRQGSYSVVENGKFVEKLRIDPATPPGMKGPNHSHYHLDGGGTHYSPRPGDLDPGFSP
jgi:RHS repeat-associated protein